MKSGKRFRPPKSFVKKKAKNLCFAKHKKYLSTTLPWHLVGYSTSAEYVYHPYVYKHSQYIGQGHSHRKSHTQLHIGDVPYKVGVGWQHHVAEGEEAVEERAHDGPVRGRCDLHH